MNDTLFGLFLIFGFVAFIVIIPLSVASSVLCCVAFSKTRAWQKEKALAASMEADVEMEGLVEDEEEDEPLDSEDEAEINARKAASKKDYHLTAYQKWKKEMKESWTGEAQKAEAERKAQEVNAKFARDVARQMLRDERKRQKKMQRAQGGKAQEAAQDAEAEPTHALPTYDVATASTSS